MWMELPVLDRPSCTFGRTDNLCADNDQLRCVDGADGCTICFCRDHEYAGKCCISWKNLLPNFTHPKPFCVLDVLSTGCHPIKLRGIGFFGLTDSVWPFRSEPFRSRDFSVLVVSVLRHFGQTMKSCRKLTC